MHCISKSLIVICRYHHFTHRAANHCCQSLSEGDAGKTRGGHTSPDLVVVARASGQSLQWGATVQDGRAERTETKDENKNRYVAY